MGTQCVDNISRQNRTWFPTYMVAMMEKARRRNKQPKQKMCLLKMCRLILYPSSVTPKMNLMNVINIIE